MDNFFCLHTLSYYHSQVVVSAEENSVAFALLDVIFIETAQVLIWSRVVQVYILYMNIMYFNFVVNLGNNTLVYNITTLIKICLIYHTNNL